jgi:hypothetical protein
MHGEVVRIKKNGNTVTKEQHSIHTVNKIVAFGVQIFMKVTFSQRFCVQKRERSVFRI